GQRLRDEGSRNRRAQPRLPLALPRLWQAVHRPKWNGHGRFANPASALVLCFLARIDEQKGRGCKRDSASNRIELQVRALPASSRALRNGSNRRRAEAGWNRGVRRNVHRRKAEKLGPVLEVECRASREQLPDSQEASCDSFCSSATQWVRPSARCSERQ